MASRTAQHLQSARTGVVAHHLEVVRYSGGGPASTGDLPIAGSKSPSVNDMRLKGEKGDLHCQAKCIIKRLNLEGSQTTQPS